MTAPSRRAARWIATTAVVAAVAFGGRQAYLFASALDGTLGAPCDRAARFVRAAELPAGTHDRRCTTGQWMSISYELDFRAPREEAEAWLRASYPDEPVRRGDCWNGSDACAHPQPRPVPHTDENGDRQGDVLNVRIDYEDGDVAHVRVSGVTI
ncbi:hypothetical protein [Streptomyces sp. NPDC048606]|uniref:hypothetical protein n=1 Tax=Streptomyces sp. NPDC048606 TaxID=3154726 RepID=UPI00342A26A0